MPIILLLTQIQTRSMEMELRFRNKNLEAHWVYAEAFHMCHVPFTLTDKLETWTWGGEAQISQHRHRNYKETEEKSSLYR